MPSQEILSNTQEMSELIARLQAGDLSARDALIEQTCDRLRVMVRNQLRKFPGVRRWEETGDVLQGVLIEVTRRLESVKPADARAFFALSASIIRCRTIDLKRHYYGPLGHGAHYSTLPSGSDSPSPVVDPSSRLGRSASGSC